MKKLRYICFLILFISFISHQNSLIYSYADSSTNVNQEKNEIDVIINSILSYRKSDSFSKVLAKDFKSRLLNLLNNSTLDNTSSLNIKVNYVLGVCDYYLLELDKAKNYLEICQTNFNNSTSYEIKQDCYYLLSKIYLDEGNLEQSSLFFKKGINSASQINKNPFLPYIYILRAKDLCNKNTSYEDIQGLLDLAISTSLSNETNNIHLIYFESGKILSQYFEDVFLSSKYFLKSQKLSKDIGDVNTEIISNIYLSLNYFNFENYKESYNILNSLISNRRYREYLTTYQYTLCYIYLSQSLILLNDLDQSDRYLSLAYSSLSLLDSSDKYVCSILLEYTKSLNFFYKKDYSNSLKAVDEAISIYEKSKPIDIKSNLNIQLLIHKGDVLIKNNYLTNGLNHHLDVLEIAKNKGNINKTLNILYKISNDYILLKNNKQANIYLNEYINTKNQTNMKNISNFLSNFSRNMSIDSKYNSNYDYIPLKFKDLSIYYTALIVLLFIVIILLFRLVINSYKRTVLLESDLNKYIPYERYTNLYTKSFADTFLDFNWKNCQLNTIPVSLILIDFNLISNDLDIYEDINNILPKIQNNCYSLNHAPNINILDCGITYMHSENQIGLILLNTDINMSKEISKSIFNTIDINCNTYSNIKSIYIGIATLIPNKDITPSLLIKKASESLFYTKNCSNENIAHLDDIVEIPTNI